MSENIKTTVEKAVNFVIVNDILEPMNKELTEARGLVTADYQTYLEQQWIESLRSKYPYKVNTKLLKKLL